MNLDLDRKSTKCKPQTSRIHPTIRGGNQLHFDSTYQMKVLSLVSNVQILFITWVYYHLLHCSDVSNDSSRRRQQKHVVVVVVTIFVVAANKTRIVAKSCFFTLHLSWQYMCFNVLQVKGQSNEGSGPVPKINKILMAPTALSHHSSSFFTLIQSHKKHSGAYPSHISLQFTSCVSPLLYAQSYYWQMHILGESASRLHTQLLLHHYTGKNTPPSHVVVKTERWLK